jgi:hypothetical protein
MHCLPLPRRRGARLPADPMSLGRESLWPPVPAILADPCARFDRIRRSPRQFFWRHGGLARSPLPVVVERQFRANRKMRAWDRVAWLPRAACAQKARQRLVGDGNHPIPLTNHHCCDFLADTYTSVPRNAATARKVGSCAITLSGEASYFARGCTFLATGLGIRGAARLLVPDHCWKRVGGHRTSVRQSTHASNCHAAGCHCQEGQQPDVAPRGHGASISCVG